MWDHDGFNFFKKRNRKLTTTIQAPTKCIWLKNCEYFGKKMAEKQSPASQTTESMIVWDQILLVHFRLGILYPLEGGGGVG